MSDEKTNVSEKPGVDYDISSPHSHVGLVREMYEEEFEALKPFLIKGGLCDAEGRAGREAYRCLVCALCGQVDYINIWTVLRLLNKD